AVEHQDHGPARPGPGQGDPPVATGAQADRAGPPLRRGRDVALSTPRRPALLLTAALLLLAGPARAEPVRMPGGGALAEVDFERPVVALLGRQGCSAGSCHGSFQGKGGFRLSLFSHDPGRDYLALTRDGLGRRVNTADPGRSLLLLKPTAQVGHEGGRRFARDSWHH